MNPLSSRVLDKLRAQRIATILKINLSDPRVIEIAGSCNVDAVWLCTEHVPNDWIGLEGQIRAARLRQIDAFVRVSRGSYSDYVRPLECGAAGIIVPHVSTSDEARQVVEWTRFHPLGKRALDGGNVDGDFCRLPLSDYFRISNHNRAVVLQIESPEALEDVEEIAAVPGFDLLLFGPGDFSHRIGRPGEINHPEVVAARRRVAAAARKHGKFAMSAGLVAPVPELIAEGHGLIGIGADVVGIAQYIEGQRNLVTQHLRSFATASTPAAKPYLTSNPSVPSS